MDDSQITHQNDPVREEFEEQHAGPSLLRAWPRGARGLLVAAVLVVGGYTVWQWRGPAVTYVPLAVSQSDAQAAGQAVERSGIPVEWREGHPWVPAEHVQRASQAATGSLSKGRASHPIMDAVGEESILLSVETARARRLAAMMGVLEQMIERQAGVAQARVVLADASRPGGPGTHTGPSAAVTVTMTEGTMTQDMVDAVAALISGSVPGLAPERVAVIDANAHRHRVPRNAEERRAAQARWEQEQQLAQWLRAGLPDAAEAEVAVHVDPTGVPHALVTMPHAYAHRVASGMGAVTPEAIEQVLLAEEDRLALLAQSMLVATGACREATAVVTVARGETQDAPLELPVQQERTVAHAGVGKAMPSGLERERLTPLGSGSRGEAVAPDAGTLLLLALAACAIGGGAMIAQRRGRARRQEFAGASTAATGMVIAHQDAVPHAMPETGFDEEPSYGDQEAFDASDAVRADPEQAVTVVCGWLDAGYDARAALVVVALDSGAAGALLRAMPPALVRRVTVALAELGTPSGQELAEAGHSLVEELAMLRDQAQHEASAV